MNSFGGRPKDDFTHALIRELDNELRQVNFPRVTFIPTVDKAQREQELITMMERNNAEN